MAEQTKAYRFNGGLGKHRDEKGRLVGEGEVVQLTASQAEAFKDRFEAVGEGFVLSANTAGTNNTPNATEPDGAPGQNPDLGQQESAAAQKAVDEAVKKKAAADKAAADKAAADKAAADKAAADKAAADEASKK
jgi:membrane protein involved in colicin uptake